MDMENFLLNAAAGTGATILCDLGSATWDRYLKKYTLRGGFVDPRPEFEIFMDDCGYFPYAKDKGLDACPWPNPNPDTIFGRFAARKGYFKR